MPNCGYPGCASKGTLRCPNCRQVYCLAHFQVIGGSKYHRVRQCALCEEELIQRRMIRLMSDSPHTFFVSLVCATVGFTVGAFVGHPLGLALLALGSGLAVVEALDERWVSR